MNRAEVEAAIITMVAELMKIDREKIRPEMYLMGKEIGLDSLGFVRLFVKVGQRFPERFKNKNVNDVELTTIQALVDSILQ